MILLKLRDWHALCVRAATVDWNVSEVYSSDRKGGERIMELFKRLLVEEDGQGLVEYTLIVVLVALVFWVAIKNTNIGSQLASGWSKVTACVTVPSNCDTAS